jgi:UDP-glucose 4-epimerase
MKTSGRGGRFLIVGGAGFIGSHFVDRLLAATDIERVRIFDNFSSGRMPHISHHMADPRFQVIRGDAKDVEALVSAMDEIDVVIHLASNPDIARAASDPQIDFVEGTSLTNNIVEAMRRRGVARILYASGSGVYGDVGYLEAFEDYGPMVPTSTYGASKLAGEALIAAYAAMFGITGCAFRFGNVVGDRQTHGVGFDFIHRLSADSSRLRILGDGKQSKSYIHVSDVIDAVLLAHLTVDVPFRPFNVATGDYITVREIADLAVDCMGCELSTVVYDYSGGDRGWKGDVPIVRLNTERIRQLGWSNRLTTSEAICRSLREILENVRTDSAQNRRA